MFLFQRDEKDEYGDAVHLWYNLDLERWQISTGQFQHINNGCYMYIVSQGKQKISILEQFIPE